jgi:hypothetical protein
MPERQSSLQKLGATDFAGWLESPDWSIPSDLAERMNASDLQYELLCGSEHDRVVLEILRKLDQDKLARTGPERRQIWEMAWSERSEAFKASSHSLSHLTPNYFDENPVLRFRGNYVRPKVADFQNIFSKLFREALFRKYFSDQQEILEFGCGSGYNLVQLAGLFPTAKLTGLDWAQAAVDLVAEIGQVHKLNITSRLFDFNHPDQSTPITSNSAILTMCALEQVGEGYGPFLEFLLRTKPRLCLHMEPLAELYSPDCLVDYLGDRYHRQRNYLSGFVTALAELEKSGRIEILAKVRVPFGNQFHDGYSYLVWRPKQ